MADKHAGAKVANEELSTSLYETKIRHRPPVFSYAIQEDVAECDRHCYRRGTVCEGDAEGVLRGGK